MTDSNARVVALLQRLVQQCSYSGQESGVIEVARAEMQALGYDEVWLDDTGNLIGVLKGKRPGGKVLFDAHCDEVLVTTPEAWSHSPFSGEVSEGKVWGRGSTDNKGSLAAMIVGLAGVPRDEIAGTIYVVASVGEEVHEGTGLAQVVDCLTPDWVVIGEPTDCRLGNCQRGRARLTFTVRGRAAHSSANDQSGNAVYALGRLIRRLEQYPLPSDAWVGAGIQAPIEVISNPYPSLSTLPVECRVTIDRRLVLDETAAGVEQSYRDWVAEIEGVAVNLDTVTYTSYTGRSFTEPDFHPAWLTEAGSPLVQASQAALSEAGMNPDLISIPYCTNGSYSAGVAGIPAVVLGPGNIVQAHAMNEFLEIAQLQQALTAYQALARGFGSLSAA
jgi:putative selenium metabolism hydrolase